MGQAGISALWKAIESLFSEVGVKGKNRLYTHPADDLEA
jgi:hypothetical protein